VEFKNCYHEMQKEPHVKEEMYQRVLQFIGQRLGEKDKCKAFGKYDRELLKLGKF